MNTVCDIYKSSRDQELYVYVKFRTELAEVLPEALLSRLGKPSKVMSLELHPQRQLARVDVNKVITALDEAGYYVQLPPQPFSHQHVPSNGE